MPCVPVIPWAPIVPCDPIAPCAPTVPCVPVVPWAPIIPCVPVVPCVPVTPCVPTTPWIPCAPVVPCKDKSLRVTKLPDASVNNISVSVVPVGTDVNCADEPVMFPSAIKSPWTVKPSTPDDAVAAYEADVAVSALPSKSP